MCDEQCQLLRVTSKPHHRAISDIHISDYRRHHIRVFCCGDDNKDGRSSLRVDKLKNYQHYLCELSPHLLHILGCPGCVWPRLLSDGVLEQTRLLYCVCWVGENNLFLGKGGFHNSIVLVESGVAKKFEAYRCKLSIGYQFLV